MGCLAGSPLHSVVIHGQSLSQTMCSPKDARAVWEKLKNKRDCEAYVAPAMQFSVGYGHCDCVCDREEKRMGSLLRGNPEQVSLLAQNVKFRRVCRDVETPADMCGPTAKDRGAQFKDACHVQGNTRSRCAIMSNQKQLPAQRYVPSWPRARCMSSQLKGACPSHANDAWQPGMDMTLQCTPINQQPRGTMVL